MEKRRQKMRYRGFPFTITSIKENKVSMNIVTKDVKYIYNENFKPLKRMINTPRKLKRNPMLIDFRQCTN